MNTSATQRERRLWVAVSGLAVLQLLTLALLYTGSHHTPTALSSGAEIASPARRRLLADLSDMVKIVDGVVVFDAPVHLKQGGEVGVEGDADTKLTVNAGFKVVGMTNLNSLRVRYTSQLGVEWKAGFPAYLPDLPLAVFGTGSAWFNPAAKQGNPVTVIVPGAVKTYSDNKDTSYSKDWSLDNTDGFVVLGGAQ